MFGGRRSPSRLGTVLRSGFVRYALGPGLLASAAVLDGVGKVITVVSGGVLVEGASLAAQSHEKRLAAKSRQQKNADHVKELLQAWVGLLESHHKVDGARFRANVMVVDGDTMSITYSSGFYTEQEMNLEWRRGEGTTGHAWDTCRTQVAPLDDQPLPELTDAQGKTRPWGCTRNQILATADHVRWVISVPIVDPHDPTCSTVLAVLSVDDNVAPTDQYAEVIPPAVETFAQQVAKPLMAILLPVDDDEEM